MSEKVRQLRPPVRRTVPPRAPLRVGHLMVGGARDPAERAAEARASQVLAGGALRRLCADCAEEDAARRAAAAPAIAPGSTAAPAPDAARAAVAALGPGRAMAPIDRGFFEPRFGRDFGDVRLHEGAAADRATTLLGARAFALGTDVALSSGARDRATLAHELAHVEAEGPARRLQRDLAIEPPAPEAEVAELTAEERAAAISYNQRRFEDPFTITIIRDVMGISRWPAVIDDAFIDALLGWQARRNLRQDAKFGPDTTQTFVDELLAEDQQRLANLLRSDNFVQVRTVSGPIYPGCGVPNAALFVWEVGFRTSLRNGFIIQRVDNVWNIHGAPLAAWRPTPHYWEAWRVNARGQVLPRLGAVNDQWVRPRHPRTRGDWRMTGTLYTVLNLPATFAARGAAGHVPASVDLRSTLRNPGADLLGLPEGFLPIEVDERSRTIGGEWNCSNADPALNFNRRA